MQSIPVTWPNIAALSTAACIDCEQVDVYDNCVGTEATLNVQFYDDSFQLTHDEDFTLPLDCDADNDGSPASEDCDESDPLTYPGASEQCDGLDNDCDGIVDEETVTTTYFADADGDGFGDITDTTESCLAPANYVDNSDDCDDSDPTVSPAAAEVCDERDNDCNGLIDDNLVQSTFYADTDGDGYGDADAPFDACGPVAGYVADNTDCDDSNYTVAPGRTGICDGVDNDCDTDVDEDCEADADGDGWGESIDCDDTDASINPDADERCDGIDNDCDSDIDEEPVDGSSYYTDADGDGYGDASSLITECSAPAGTVSDSSDCDDDDVAVFPGAVELCNGIDSDCNGLTDDDCKTDDDGDGYSALEDCNDNNAAINPGAVELCDGIDNDCDTYVDIDATDLQIWYLDADGDADSVQAPPEAFGCNAPLGYVDNNLDCDDSDASLTPDAPEVCDGIDNNCDQLIDVDATDAPAWYADADGDGFGDPNNIVRACNAETGLVSNDLDCDDTDSNTYPAAIEIWYDGIDQNCDGIDDDRDQDGFLNAQDCDDTDASAYPGSSTLRRGLHPHHIW